MDHANRDAPALAVSGSRTGEREITLHLGDLAAYAAARTNLDLALAFGDRRRFIACEHPGMQDIYELHVNLTLDASGALVHSRLNERIEYGDI